LEQVAPDARLERERAVRDAVGNPAAPPQVDVFGECCERGGGLDVDRHRDGHAVTFDHVRSLHRSCLHVSPVPAAASVSYPARVKLGLIAILVASTAHADSRLIDDDTFAVKAPGTLGVDAGLVIGLPSALPTGMATGVGAGITHACGCMF